MNDSLTRQLDRLEGHLREENPILLDAVRTFRRLDEVAWKLGLTPPDRSLASQVPWWPLVAVLGTFSAGKSTFINGYLGQPVQISGNQAVDDRFTAICFSAGEGPPQALPGLALDADPRFPFYQVSRDIEEVSAGEGRRIDAYLQLKTCSSPRLRGKIIIDSPGFDADEQRTSIRVRGMGWQRGMRSDVRFAAWMAAMRATPSTSPLPCPPRRMRRRVSGRISIRPSATAARRVSSLAPTSTMCAAPSLRK